MLSAEASPQRSPLRRAIASASSAARSLAPLAARDRPARTAMTHSARPRCTSSPSASKSCAAAVAFSTATALCRVRICAAARIERDRATSGFLRLRRAAFNAPSPVSTAASTAPEDDLDARRGRSAPALAARPRRVRSAMASMASASTRARSASPWAVRLSARNSSSASRIGVVASPAPPARSSRCRWPRACWPAQARSRAVLTTSAPGGGGARRDAPCPAQVVSRASFPSPCQRSLRAVTLSSASTS